MAATLILNKYQNSAMTTVDSGGGTGVTNMHWLSANTDSTATPLNNPLTRPASAGSSQFSYENWHKLYVTAMGGSTRLNNFKVYMSAGEVALSGHSARVNSNLVWSGTGSTRTTMAVDPVAVSGSPAVCSGSMQSSLPASNNVGISGSLTGSTSWLAKAHDSTDFMVTQFGINNTITIGQTETKTFTFQYDEQ